MTYYQEKVSSQARYDCNRCLFCGARYSPFMKFRPDMRLETEEDSRYWKVDIGR
jgi:hypothetical protein